MQYLMDASTSSLTIYSNIKQQYKYYCSGFLSFARVKCSRAKIWLFFYKFPSPAELRSNSWRKFMRE